MLVLERIIRFISSGRFATMRKWSTRSIYEYNRPTVKNWHILKMRNQIRHIVEKISGKDIT